MPRIAFVAGLVLFLTGCSAQFRTPTNQESRQARQLPSGTVQVNGPILSYANIVDGIAPAVVTIRTSQRIKVPQQFPFFDFPQLFGGGVPRSQPRTEVQQALGSGVIVRADGYILTNQHVIDGAKDIKVDLSNRQTYSGTLVGQDAPSDLAVVKIDASGLPVLPLGDSDQVRIGDVCLAVGNPLGVGESVTDGIISAKGRSTNSVGSGSFQDFLQTDAPINQGNSGGALVNTRGELIGINSAILSSNGGFVGIGFAIPSNMAKNVMQQLIRGGKVQRGMLGVTVQPVTSDIAASLGLKQVQGVMVNAVNAGGPAEQAGVKQGDVIQQINGKDVNGPNDLRNEIAAMSPGTEVTLTIWRNDAQQQIAVKLGALSAQTAQQAQLGNAGQLGVAVTPVTPSRAAQLGLGPGAQGLVIDSIDPNGAAASAGLQEGDVIVQVNRQPVRTPNDLVNALHASANRPALLMIDRGNQTFFIAVPLTR